MWLGCSSPLIMALSFFNRNNLGFSLPFCGFGVTVPISINPKPKHESSSMKDAFLSKPAAKPIGFGNLIPKTSVSNNLFLKQNTDLNSLSKPGIFRINFRELIEGIHRFGLINSQYC
jgi:hypothetical protein